MLFNTDAEVRMLVTPQKRIGSRVGLSKHPRCEVGI